jgi:hypothetical protein
MTDEEEIEHLEKRLIDAVRHSNQYSLEKLLHAELALIGTDGQLISSAEDSGSCLIKSLYTPCMEKYDRLINLTGNTAMVMLVERGNGKYGKLPFEGRLQCMRIWKKTGSDWKVAAASRLHEN